MAITSITQALERIALADTSSPLAVFTCKWPCLVKTAFANTLMSQSYIQQGDSSYLGCFHRESLPEARRRLVAYEKTLADAA